jgi:hypothetical protein
MQVKQENLYIIDRIGKYCFVRSHQRPTTGLLFTRSCYRLYFRCNVHGILQKPFYMRGMYKRQVPSSQCLYPQWRVLVCHSYFHTNDSSRSTWVPVAQYLVVFLVYCISMVGFFNFFWPLYCLSFDLRLLITPLMSSNLS